MANEIGKLIQVDISTEMKKSYLNYAMSVIVQRALPDVRDGLKPVHRRILFAMHKMGLTHQAKHVKSAKVAGEVMGNYHPHGDAPIYDAMVRLAQDFSLRYPLIDGQGNFGSIDGDPPAAMRYTEARMAAITAELLVDIEKETVDYIPTFDATTMEPVYMPGKLPNLLLMGSEGIAVGMATKIPPHNLGEVISAILHTISKTTFTLPTTTSEPVASPVVATGSEVSKVVTDTVAQLHCDVTIDELLEHIKGPDFPTAGSIYDIAEIRNAYITGRGKIIIRGKAEIEEIGQGKSAIIITEIPYQVNKALLVSKIADLAKEKRIDGISDLRDESDRRGMRVVVELKRDAAPKKVLNNLFKLTALQTSFPANMVALVNGTPQTLNLKLIIEEYLKHRYTVIRKRSEFELRQARAREHILEGLKIAVDHIDEVIKTIRASKDQEEAKKNLITTFKLSEIQSVAILDMQLRRLAALERQKIEDELALVRETIAYLLDLLAHPEKILGVIKEELEKLKDKYADARRTKVFKGKVGEFSEEDLIANEATVVTMTQTGYIKRQSLNSFQTQHRGGKGIRGMTTKDEDAITHLRFAMTHDNLLFFTNKGKVYQIKAYEISESSRVSKGTAIVNLLNIEAGEKIESFIVATSDKKSAPVTTPAGLDPAKRAGKKGYVFLTTRKGTVKKSALSEFENIRRGGMIAIKLDAGDELVWSNISTGTDDVLIVSKQGKAIRFGEMSVRPMGRGTIGVRGIKLAAGDEVISQDVLSKGDLTAELLTIMENGLGKKTVVTQFPKQERGGQGVKVAKVSDKTGVVVVSQIIPPNSTELIMTSKKGQIVKLELSSIPRLHRDTQGVILMRFSDAGTSDGIAAATCIESPVA